MRVVFGVLSLLVVVAIIGILAKKQLGAMSGGSSNASAASAPAGTVAMPTGTPQQQVQQVGKQVQDAMQQARPMPDETK